MSGQRQFYLEEDFPVHPKTVKAGGDAAWLYVCGMAWASKHLTGDIPKSMVPQLSDRRKPMILAERLCDAGLWHDHTDHYEIHDFETRNKKSLARRRKAKHAAERRWKEYEPDAPSMPRASDGDAPSIAQAMLNGCSTVASSEPTNQRTNEPTTENPASFVTNADPETASADESVFADALEILYHRRPPPHTNPDAHHAVIIRGILEQYADTIANLSKSVRWTPLQLADWIEPVYKPPPKLAAYRPKCETCEDRPGAYDMDAAGNAIRCPDCSAKETA